MRQKLVLIGASTGGPGHLKTLLRDIPHTVQVPIIIAQHMNPVFIPSFAQQFKTELKAPVSMMHEPQSLYKGGVYICERNCLVSFSHGLKISFEDAPKGTLYNPSIDALFHSAVPLCHKVDVLTILLTGIGHDGASGMAALKKAGATCMAEDEASCVVFGMPKKAQELTPELTMLPLLEIKMRLERFLNAVF